MYVSHKTWLVEQNISQLRAKKSHLSKENLGNSMAESGKARENPPSNGYISEYKPQTSAGGDATRNQHHNQKYQKSDMKTQQQQHTRTETTIDNNKHPKYGNSITFNIERRKKVELERVDITASPRKYGDNSYSDYFDNLIALIDEAAKELSL